jgi:hypothetical protein
MRKECSEDHHKILRVLLLVLAALNGWIAYAILSEHPIVNRVGSHALPAGGWSPLKSARAIHIGEPPLGPLSWHGGRGCSSQRVLRP